MNPVLYENGLIRLRLPEKKDAKALYELTQEPEVMQYYGDTPFASLKDAENEIEWFLDQFRHYGGRWVIAEKKTDTYIGDIGFFNSSREDMRTELGFKLAKNYWGRKIMSECIRVCLHYGFDISGYNRIQAIVDPRNLPCKGMLKKLGFMYEGLLRDYEFEHGHFVDVEMHSKLKRDLEQKETV